MKRIINKNSGQTLFEVLVALGITVITIVALVKVSTISVGNASFARKQSQATQYAKRGMEYLRKLTVEKKWTDFTTLYLCTENSLVPLIIITDTSFSISNECCVDKFDSIGTCINDDCTGASPSCWAKVTVSWQDSHGIHSSELVTQFAKY